MIIPIDSSVAFSTIRTVLSGTAYLLVLRYSQRQACFFLDVKLDDGTPIASGIKVVSNFPLLHRCVDERRPAGELVARPSGSDDTTPDLGELGPGQRVELVYLEPA